MRNILLSLFLLTLLSCSKDNSSRIPEVFVNYQVTFQEFDIKKNENGILLVNGHGVAGLMIIKISANTYKAFDRCSSVEPEKRCVVVPESSFTASDPCSGAKYSLFDGSPAKAPATRGLKEYQVNTTNFQLIVSNGN
jgi:hypothetical protein